MGTKTLTASELRTNLAEALDAVNNEEILIVTREVKRSELL